MQAQVLVNESWSTQFAPPSGAGWSALSWRLPANGSSSGIAYRYAFPDLDYQKGLYYQKDSQGYYYFCGNIVRPFTYKRSLCC